VSSPRIARHVRFVARNRRVLQSISYFFALRERPEHKKDCKNLSEKIAAPRKKLLASACCRTRQFLPSAILIKATEILRLWRVELSRSCAQMMPSWT
jgi:hypothetical protein